MPRYRDLDDLNRDLDRGESAPDDDPFFDSDCRLLPRRQRDRDEEAEEESDSDDID